MFSCPAVEILFYLVLVGWAALLALVQVQYTLPKIIWIAALNRAGPSSNGCNGIQYVCLLFSYTSILSGPETRHIPFLLIKPLLDFYAEIQIENVTRMCWDFLSYLFSVTPLWYCQGWTLLLKKSIIATFREYMCSVRWRTTVSLSIFLSF